MERDTPSRANTILLLLAILLAALGDLTSNLLSASVSLPAELARATLPALGVIALAECAVALTLGRLQGFAGDQDPRRRSVLRRRLTLLFIIVAEILAAAGGAVANLAAPSLPPSLVPYAVPLFIGATLLIIGVAVLLFRAQTTPSADSTNRPNFLKRLQQRYRDRQDGALRGAVLLELGLREAPEAIVRPDLLQGTPQGLQMPHDTRSLPAGASIDQAYDAAGGRLLILGAPGAGKSTLLVELALALLGRARMDESAPLPVVFNLSTWGQNRAPLGEWLVEDLLNSYRIPTQIAQGWVHEQRVLPLLDGFDEVEPPHRAACAAAINTFAHAHPDLPVVACSRMAEYEEEATPLDLRSSVVVQPLTDAQITRFLDWGGAQLGELRTAVEADTELREVVRTPLLLSLVTLTYRDLPRAAIPSVGDVAAWRGRLFENYVATMLARPRREDLPAADRSERTEHPRYSAEQTERSLSWLALQMRQHGMVELYLELLRSDWLPDRHTRRRLIVFWTLSLTAAGGLVGGLVGSLLSLLGWPAIHGQGGLLVVLGVGILGGLALGLVAGVGNASSALIMKGVINSVAAGYSLGRIPQLLASREGRQELVTVVAGGLILALPLAVFETVIAGFGAGLLVSLFGMLVLVLSEGLYQGEVDVQDILAPGEGIRRWQRRGTLVALSLALATGVLGGLYVRVGGNVASGVVVTLVYAVGLATLAYLNLGGGYALANAALIRALSQADLVPPNLTHFLDYAADHVLLQKVGGGYRFVHVLLRDHFADLEMKRLPVDITATSPHARHKP